MISILIPVFNYPVKDLVFCIREMAQRAQVDYEILVVDDASTDQAILKENSFLEGLKDCTYFKFEVNKGRTATTQFLAEKARFENLLFLDADVLPKNADFLEVMLKNLGKGSVVFGGIAYPEKLQNPLHALRYCYGKSREVKPASIRKTQPYLSIIIQHLLIDKSLFLRCNPAKETGYGLDILLSHSLKKASATVLHLDNPTVHYGLETNAAYLAKTKEGLQTMVKLQQSGKVATDYRPLQRLVTKLQLLNLDGIYLKSFKAFLRKAERNLVSSNPSLAIFDAWRLYHYLTYTRDEA